MKKLLLLILVASVFAACSSGGSSSGSTSNVDTSLIPTEQGDKWGFIDHKGTWVINPQFDRADWFRDGLARVYSAGKYGFIDTKGTYKIEPSFKGATPFFDGLAWTVVEGGAPTAIDTSGKEKFVLKEAKEVYSFSEGLAAFANADGNFGFVDKSGKIVINTQFEEVSNNFYNGLAVIEQGGLQGYVNSKGEIIINPQFELAGNFNDGLAFFYNSDFVGGYIDTKGAYAINPQFEEVRNFSEGLAAVSNGNDDWGYVDKSGKIVVNYQFDMAREFSGGLAAVRQGGKFGFIDKKGMFVINPQFDAAFDFHSNTALVQSGGKWGIVDKKGQYVVNPQFEDVGTIYSAFYTESDYYDPAPIVSALFEKTSGTDSFDGFTVGSTLQTVKDNPSYGNFSSNSDKYIVRSGNAEFHFSGEVYTLTPIYRTVWGREVATGNHTKTYNYGVELQVIKYSVPLGDGYGRGATIAAAIKDEIEKRYGVTMTVNPDRYLALRDGSLGFAVIFYPNAVTLYVTFGSQFALDGII